MKWFNSEIGSVLSCSLSPVIQYLPPFILTNTYIKTICSYMGSKIEHHQCKIAWSFDKQLYCPWRGQSIKRQYWMSQGRIKIWKWLHQGCMNYVTSYFGICFEYQRTRINFGHACFHPWTCWGFLLFFKCSNQVTSGRSVRWANKYSWWSRRSEITLLFQSSPWHWSKVNVFVLDGFSSDSVFRTSEKRT